jgi:hypothetical protein
MDFSIGGFNIRTLIYTIVAFFLIHATIAVLYGSLFYYIIVVAVAAHLAYKFGKNVEDEIELFISR